MTLPICKSKHDCHFNIYFPALANRFCLNIANNRNNGTQGNRTIPETSETQYDEIDGAYYNPSNINGRPELTHVTLHNANIETLLSSSNSRIVENMTANNDGTANNNHEIIPPSNDLNIQRSNNASTRSSSDDSYLGPCRNYISLEIDFNDEHSHQIREPENLDDGLPASNSESSETYIKSDQQYETLAATDIVEHSYENPIATY
ncbi:unnamed protein product [Mytilus coruscus]|uniref:Uncharacterized protein n=1 Tax=Mytilus coruscus TaxID=42192 RepID=A0A6J8CAT4_MYTCO|nr:unnamed protein product [Mytilus coruscus]